VKAAVIANASFPTKSDGSPDFKKMTAAQKVAFARERIKADLSRQNGDNAGTPARPRRV
jgi:hypothetical protein